MKEVDKFYKAAFSLPQQAPQPKPQPEASPEASQQNWFSDSATGRSTRRVIGNEAAEDIAEKARKTMNFMRGVTHKLKSGFGNFTSSNPVAEGFSEGMSSPWNTSGALSTHMLQGVRPVSLSHQSFGTNLANTANNVRHFSTNALTMFNPFLGGNTALRNLGSAAGAIGSGVRNVFQSAPSPSSAPSLSAAPSVPAAPSASKVVQNLKSFQGYGIQQQPGQVNDPRGNYMEAGPDGRLQGRSYGINW